MDKSAEGVLIDVLVYYGDPEDIAAAMARRIIKDLKSAGFEIRRLNKSVSK